MASFSWLKKSVKINKNEAFDENEDDSKYQTIDTKETDIDTKGMDVDTSVTMETDHCINQFPTGTSCRTQESIKRLIDEAELMVSIDRHWSAVNKFDEALKLISQSKQSNQLADQSTSQLEQTDYKVFEMKAQVLNLLHEIFPATESAQESIRIKPNWWIAHQTLGRCHLNTGNIREAIKSFERAIHLNPSEGDPFFPLNCN